MSAGESGAWAFLGGSPGGGELLLVFVVFLLLFGAKKLPEIARMIGRALEEFSRSARQVRDEIMNAADPDAPAPPPAQPLGGRGEPPASPEPSPYDSPPTEDAPSSEEL